MMPLCPGGAPPLPPHPPSPPAATAAEQQVEEAQPSSPACPDSAPLSTSRRGRVVLFSGAIFRQGSFCSRLLPPLFRRDPSRLLVGLSYPPLEMPSLLPKGGILAAQWLPPLEFEKVFSNTKPIIRQLAGSCRLEISGSFSSKPTFPSSALGSG